MNQLSEKRKVAVKSVMKNAIYEATVSILLEHGLDGLTMDRVAEAAGIAKGTLYNYFKDKKHLQLYVYFKVSKSLHGQVLAIGLSDASAPEKLKNTIELLFHGFEKHRLILVILAQGRIQNLIEYSTQLAQFAEFANIDAVKNPIDKVIQTIIQEGIKSKHFHPFDSSLATDMIHGVVTSILDKQIKNNQPRVLEEHIAQSIRFIMEGLKINPPSSTTSVRPE